MANGENGENGGDTSLADRIASLRQRIERAGTATRAKERAKARSERKGAKARERAARERRIARNNPESLGEAAKAATREARETASAVGDTTDAATSLVASELGVSREQASGVAAELNDTLQQFGDRLDLDGDADTDLLAISEPPTEAAVGQPMGVGEPLIETGPTEPVNRGGTEIDMTEPAPGEIEF